MGPWSHCQDQLPRDDERALVRRAVPYRSRAWQAASIGPIAVILCGRGLHDPVCPGVRRHLHHFSCRGYFAPCRYDEGHLLAPYDLLLLAGKRQKLSFARNVGA